MRSDLLAGKSIVISLSLSLSPKLEEQIGALLALAAEVLRESCRMGLLSTIDLELSPSS